MKTWIKRIAITAGTFALATGVAGATLFAADTSKTSSDVRLTKTLVAPDKSTFTELPALTTFRFTFTDGKPYPYTAAEGVSSTVDAKVQAPAIDAKEITFTYADLTNGTDGTSSVTKQSLNLIANVNWPKPGKYVYTIKEESGSVDTAIGATTADDSISYSGKTYELSVWVTYDTNGKLVGTGGVTKTDGTDATKKDKVDSGKVPGTDTTKDPDTETVIVPNPADAEGSFNFENIYKIITKTPTGGVAPFQITKKVTGNLSDQNLEFAINVSIKKTKLSSDKYTIFVKDAKGVIKDAKGQEIIPDSPTPTTVMLKHGETAYMDTITVGEPVTVTEVDTPDYEESNIAVLNGISTHGQLEAKGNFGPTDNKVDFTNDFHKDDISETGILMNNLPYLALIIVGIAGLGYYFYNKRRHNA